MTCRNKMKPKRKNLKQKLLTKLLSGFTAIYFFNRHQIFLNFQLKQAVRKLSGNKLQVHLHASSCSSNQNLLWQKFDLSGSTSNKNPDQIKIILISSQFTEYVQHTIFFIKYSSKYRNSCYPFSFFHNFKLKTEVNID